MPSRISTESTSIRPWCSTSQALTTTARHGSYARSVTAISHIVLVSWKSGSQSAVEDLVRPAIRGFVDTIPDVQSVVEGHSSSPEGLEDGFDYGFVVTFATAQARDAYLDDPVHRPVAEAIGAAAKRIVVFDI
jgi:hypothetical protein